MGKYSKVFIPTDEEFISIVKESKSYAEMLRHLGLTTRGGASSKLLKLRIHNLDIDTSHFKSRVDLMQERATHYSLDEILVENSHYFNIQKLKKRLVAEQRLKYECSICHNKGEWLGHKLTLQLDHINGINNDHRLENLRFLCPNCHSQTETYCGKNTFR